MVCNKNYRKVAKQMSFSLNGVRVPHRKNTAECSATPMTNIKTVTIPMSMHIGAPCSPLVSVGDTVKVGQRIGESTAPVSAPVHASVSGTVIAVEPRPHTSGRMVMSVVIENDKNDAISIDN